jgi:hypothetical protein
LVAGDYNVNLAKEKPTGQKKLRDLKNSGISQWNARGLPPSLPAMARRRPAPDTDLPDDSAAAPPTGIAVLPRVVFLLLLGLVMAIAVIEVRHGLRHPSLLRVSGAPPAPALTFYQKGHASAREAWLFDEPQGSAGPPRLIQRIECRPEFTAIGDIRWSANGRAVYAAGRDPQRRGVPLLRWLFEFDSASPGSHGSGRLFVSSPDFAVVGRTAFVEDAAALTARWQRHGGAGPVAVAWYDLGASGPPLFSWQTTRWENALPE